MSPEFTVEPGQVYQSCDPRGGPRIRIVSVTGNRAQVVDAYDGKRPRSVLLNTLHATGATATEKPRRTGYRLIRQGDTR